MTRFLFLPGIAFACALGNIYTFGPTFRAENSNTTRHAAEFWMIDNRAAAGELLPGGLYYSTSILITANAINTKVDEIITGSANFVTVKTVSLKIGTN